MPKSLRSVRRTRIFIATLFLLIIAAVACSSDRESETTAPTVPPRELIGNYETCTGFLDAQSIEELTGESGLFDRERVINVEGVPGLAESGAVDDCLIEVFRSFETNDVPTPGKSVALSIVKFQSSASAVSLFDSTLASALLSAGQIGDLAEVRREVVGADSYLLDIKAGGVGAIVVYVSDTAFISISATPDAEGNALLTVEQLVAAAQGVQSRLPGFAQSRFAGQ